MTVKLTGGYGENLQICLGSASQDVVKDRKISLEELEKISKFDGTANQLTKTDLTKAGFSEIDAGRILAELQQHFHSEGGKVDLTRPKDNYSGVQLILKDDLPFDPVNAGALAFPDNPGPVIQAAPSGPPPSAPAGSGSLVGDRLTDIVGDEAKKRGSKKVVDIIVEGGTKRVAGAAPLVGVAIDLQNAYGDGQAAIAAGNKGDWVGWTLYTGSAAISSFSIGSEGAVLTGVAAPAAEAVQAIANVGGAVVGVAADVWTSW